VTGPGRRRQAGWTRAGRDTVPERLRLRAGWFARAGDRGSVSAEFAVAVPAVVLLLLAGMTAVTVVGTRLRCVDAAREAALAASRGEPGVPAGVVAAPAGAAVSVDRSGQRVRATVRVLVAPLGPHLPSFTVTEQAVAAVEPDEAPVG